MTLRESPAIIVLAGSNLLLAQDAATRIARVAPAIEVVVVLACATATFCFPLMVAIGVWRHVIRRVPLRYHPSYWALVFPLGMYGVATSRMIDATDVTALDWLPPLVFGIALSAWVLTSRRAGAHRIAQVVEQAEGGGFAEAVSRDRAIAIIGDHR
jgi:tellurite resistance protein TehA-like permease